jgi:cellulose synthase/poly-beta-1,6-N-acetylglucosamine synthase-like glycosyltransferase
MVRDRQPKHRFMIVIPAHDEEQVIKETVERLRALNYPSDMYSIHIVADHCSDGTVSIAKQAGAIVHDRREGPRTGKGAALSWVFQRILGDDLCDALIVFDADTRVDVDFLQVMDERLSQGAQVIQGQHIISNPDDSWFPCLAWALLLVDNRFQNLGRANLGWSAKNMGDSICFRVEVLRKMGWGEGLTEDYQLRHRLLLEGYKISYEPSAKGLGEAPPTWSQALVQRARWLRGTREASRKFARQILVSGVKHLDMALIDGALQAYLPSYSTLTLISLAMFLVNSAQLVFFVGLLSPLFSRLMVGSWAIVLAILFIYPLIGLVLEHAPIKAYLVIFSGPFFILWRTWLAITARFGRKHVAWVRTTHSGQK